jgi:anti-sigma regulatory factor (Ser/Thr protein kinase)
MRMTPSESDLALDDEDRPNLLPEGVEDDEEFKAHSAIAVRTVDFREFAPSVEVIAEVRRFVRDVLEALDLDETCVFESQLVADELATNAATHACSIFSVAIEIAETFVRVAVRDDSNVLPIQPVTTAESIGGRGLSIVSGTAIGWGTVSLGQGKEMWADILLHAS